nr:CapA family protein [Aneurinibacillus soli]
MAASPSEAESPAALAEAKKGEQTSPVRSDDVRIVVSAAGDVTLGMDESFSYARSFPQEVQRSGYDYFVKNIRPIFTKDDLTMVNLEGTLTNATAKAQKTFRFKGKPDYATILVRGGIDAVNVANNHSHDYLQRGFNDTLTALQKYKVGYFGYTKAYTKTIKGVTVGVLGYEGWKNDQGLRDQIKRDIIALRKQGVKIVVVNFHWGIERSYAPNATQQALGKWAIDAGADLIVGHHPHVVQGIQEYKGKYIVYSLGNFMFGGNQNPSDKDTFIFQQAFHLMDGKLTAQKEIAVLPMSVSSVPVRNNYQPTPLSGKEAMRVWNKIQTASKPLGSLDWKQIQQTHLP